MHRSAYSVYVLKGSRERKNSCKSERETAVRVEKAAVKAEEKQLSECRTAAIKHIEKCMWKMNAVNRRYFNEKYYSRNRRAY